VTPAIGRRSVALSAGYATVFPALVFPAAPWHDQRSVAVEIVGRMDEVAALHALLDGAREGQA
jgi:hypothetical protein